MDTLSEYYCIWSLFRSAELLGYINNTGKPMCGLQDERAAEASAAMEVDEGTSASAAAQPKGGDERAGAKLHVLGIGGRRAKRSSVKTAGSKKTPGEIRIQKGETNFPCTGIRHSTPLKSVHKLFPENSAGTVLLIEYLRTMWILGKFACIQALL